MENFITFVIAASYSDTRTSACVANVVIRNPAAFSVDAVAVDGDVNRIAVGAMCA